MYLIENTDIYEQLKISLDDLIKTTDKWIESNFDAWKQQSLDQVAQGDLSLVLFLINENECSFFFLFKLIFCIV